MSDETNQRIHRRQITDEQTRDSRVRRKRELKDVANPVRFQISSNPSGRAELASSEQGFKKADHPMERISRKLGSKKNNARMNAVVEINAQKDQANQEKRGLHKQQGVASRAFLSTGEDEAKIEQREAKRSSHSGEAVKVTKLKSRAITDHDAVSRSSLVKEKVKVRDNGKDAALEDDNKSQKSGSANEELEDEADLDEKSAEYDETGNDDDMETPSGNIGYKDSNPEVSDAAEDDSEKLDPADDDDSEGQDTVKREADATEEEYEDVEGDGACEDVDLIDEADYRQSKIRSEPGLLEKREKHDSRVKRDDAETGEDEAPNSREETKQQLEGVEHVESSKDEFGTNSKRDIAHGAASMKSGHTPQGENSKRQAVSENLAQSDADDQAEPEMNVVNEELNESSKQEFQNDNTDKASVDEKSDLGLAKETKSSKDDKKEGIVANGEEDGKSSKQLDETGKDDKTYSDYEKRVEQQIQERIDSIKEEIKREVEEKERVRYIEMNNAKYDEMQSEIEEDEDEDNQSLDIPSEGKSVSKRSFIDEIRSPGTKAKRHILRRVKRSDTTDPRQLQAIEGVEKLDPDVLLKARLRHESIRKRSAPIYGATDEEVSEISKPLIKRSTNSRRVYLVSNEQKRSLSPRTREVRNTIRQEANANPESLNPSSLEDSSSLAQNRAKRNVERFSRRKRASAVVPGGRVAFIGYRPQDDDENDEGSEFDDDGFEDRTSNLQQDKSYAVAHSSVLEDGNPTSFLFAGVDRDRNDFLVRHKRGIHRDETARLHGGGALAQRQTRARATQMRTAKMISRKNLTNRDKRHSENVIHDTKSDSVTSLVGSSQELSPRLATEYREAFGGLQSDPGGALARFKRVKRSIHP